MFFSKDKAVQVNTGGHVIPVGRLKKILDKGHASPDHWHNHPKAKTVQHLLEKLTLRKALLIPCDERLILVEEILILDVMMPVADTALHLFEQHRLMVDDPLHPLTIDLQHVDGIAVCMNHDEPQRKAADRCITEKLGLNPHIDVSVEYDKVRELESLMIKSERYPGLHEVQQRFLMKAIMSSAAYRSTYPVSRKNGTVLSLFAWKYTTPTYSSVVT